MTSPVIGEDLARRFGLSAEEYGKVLALMGRAPTVPELGVVSVMWWEPCW